MGSLECDRWWKTPVAGSVEKNEAMAQTQLQSIIADLSANEAAQWPAHILLLFLARSRGRPEPPTPRLVQRLPLSSIGIYGYQCDNCTESIIHPDNRLTISSLVLQENTPETKHRRGPRNHYDPRA